MLDNPNPKVGAMHFGGKDFTPKSLGNASLNTDLVNNSVIPAPMTKK